MLQLTQYIQEKLKINSKSKVNKMICPKTKDDLKREILKKIIDKETDYNDIDVSKIQDFSYLFENQDHLVEIDISKWDVSNAISLKCMFNGCRYLRTTGDLGNWNVSNVADMSFMFNDCQCLTNIGDLSNWEINGTKMLGTFQNTKRLKTIGPIQHWRPDTPNYDIFSLSKIEPQPRKRV